MPKTTLPLPARSRAVALTPTEIVVGLPGLLAPEPQTPTPARTLPRRVQVVNLIAVLVPFVAAVAAAVLLWGMAFNWLYLALFLGMYLFTGFGVTIGYHRYFTHKSFRTNKFVVWLLGVAGSTSAEGSVLEWCAWHRQHHQHSDQEQDPHSPHVHEHDHEHPGTLRALFRGFLHAHMGWFLRRTAKDVPNYEKYIPDLLRDPVTKAVNRGFGWYVLAGLIVPGIIAGAVTGTWLGLGLGILWGGLVRLFFIQHVTWSINSVCHIWGARPYESHDQSRNNAVFGVLGLGEGWHNNHHAFPTSARHGLAWWQVDLSYLVIRAMSLVGLASDVKVPTAERLAAKRRFGAK